MPANDIQVGGDHYGKNKIQHWDFCQDRPYLESRCMAYIDRHQDKNGMQDIEKAFHFLVKIAEVRYGVGVSVAIQKVKPDHQNPYANVPEDE